MNQANRPAKQFLDESQLQAELTTIACDVCDIENNPSPSAVELLDILADNGNECGFTYDPAAAKRQAEQIAAHYAAECARNDASLESEDV